ncbi:uncharacterized protein TRAVEDRAFT_47177 [Trametes versicolor FP-101664 SS1]|uniref:uncharacterized protein n=1 Tax=Trametes versicolor (strain FP-101664) TaxID=717944 RepID=UPI0004622C91|nr:uncharacterized protein TRAVEDRAFT_47177 [Trametes versicolor FP-101664 SS1]EIW59875.1 hypothetical protein TRAVEDRAFT_47177 [Trametes versicolor FP-101664 SS1]
MPPRKKQKTNSGDALAVASTNVVVPTAPRRMTRAATKAATGNTTQAAAAVDGENMSLAATSRPKATTAGPDTSKRIVRKGRLQALPDLPLEIQCEIYKQLDLEDLHNLLRTCKKFNEFFLDRDNELQLWVPARANTPGIPDRPPWMSEPAFVHLLYAPNCHNCGASNIRKIIFGCFIRLCASCIMDRTVNYDEARVEAAKIDDGWALQNLFFSRSYTAIFHVQRRSVARYSDPKFNRILKDDVVRVFERYMALPGPLGRYSQDFYLQMKAETTARLPYANAIQDWLEDHEEERKAHLGDARKQRFDGILARLRDSDWKIELDFLGDEGIETLSNMPVVRQSTKLTEGSWQKVLAALDGFLNETREKRLDKELRAALTARFELLEEAIRAHYVTLPRTAKMDCRPRCIDFAFRPECRAILDVPTSETVTLDQFTTVIPTLAEKWDADRRKELLKYIRPHLGKVAPDVDPLSLAIAVFRLKNLDKSCYVDIGRMHYPTIFTHDCSFSNCFRGAKLKNAEAFRQEETYTRTVQSLEWGSYEHGKLVERPDDAVYLDGPFHLNELAGRSEAACAVQCMRRIVSALGLDPERATFDDLERSDVWLRCVTCEKARPKSAIWAMSWMRAYTHDEDHRTGQAGKSVVPKWRRVSDKDMGKVRTLRVLESYHATDFYDRALWSCSLCPAFDAKGATMAKHLQESHGVSDIAQADKDGVIYLHPNMNKSRRYKETVKLRA